MARTLVAGVLFLALGCKGQPQSEGRPPLDLASPAARDVVDAHEADSQPRATDVRTADAPPLQKAETPAPVERDAGSLPDAVERNTPPQPTVVTPQQVGRIQWNLLPKDLEVMRNTNVRLSMSWAEPPAGDVVCEWDPGDRTGTISGCNVEHVFVGGLVDRSVTLRVLVDGKQVLQDVRPLPIERLPVQAAPDSDYQLPSAPSGESGTRVLLVSWYLNSSEQALAQLQNAAEATGAGLVVLFLNGATTAQEAKSLLAAPAWQGSRALVPVFCDPSALSAVAPAEIPAPNVLEHSSAAEVPFKYSFISQGVSMTILDSREREGSVGMEKWLLDEFAQARIASHRLVLSCAALENYTQRDMGTLKPPFRFYEKLMRGDLTLFVTGSQPVFYYARYGQLATLAPGVALGSAEALPGTEAPQEELMAVVDLVPGAPPRVMPVRAGSPNTVVSMKAFPMKVGSYQRVLQPALGTSPVAPETPPVQPAAGAPTAPVPQATAPALPAAPVVLAPGAVPAPLPKSAQPVGIYPPPVEP